MMFVTGFGCAQCEQNQLKYILSNLDKFNIHNGFETHMLVVTQCICSML